MLIDLPPELAPRVRVAVGDAIRARARDGHQPPPQWPALLDRLCPENLPAAKVRELAAARSRRYRARTRAPAISDNRSAPVEANRPGGGMARAIPMGMDWSTWSAALVGGLVGSFIPATLTYLGLLRGRQSADAEAFGPAMLLLDRVNPDRVTVNFNPDPSLEAEKWAELEKQLDTARERLLVVSAGNPRLYVCDLAWSAEVKVFNAYNASAWAIRDKQTNRDNPEWMDYARKVHDEAVTAMRDLIRANFGWHPAEGVRLRWRARQVRRQADTPRLFRRTVKARHPARDRARWRGLPVGKAATCRPARPLGTASGVMPA